MSENVFDKLEKMPLKDLLNLCALAIETNMEEKRLQAILLLAETKLQKYRMLKRLGIKNA